MTGREYEVKRLEMNLTKAELGRRLGVDVGTVGRRESGRVAITQEAEYALLYLAGDPAERAGEPERETESATCGDNGAQIEAFLQQMTEQERSRVLGKHEVPERLWSVVPECVHQMYPDLHVGKK